MAQPVMQGGRSYDDNSRLQRAIGANGSKALDWVAEFVPLPDHGPVVMADYGSATGRNSIDPVAIGLLALRRRMPRSQPILVVHLDLSGNDFTALFNTLDSTEGYGTGDPNAWTCAVGGSFYRQLLPASFVTLGWCATAVHWLSRVPCALTDTFWVDHAPRDQLARWAEQAAADWHDFLTARAAELVPDGRIAIMSLRRSIDDANSYGPEAARQASVLRGMVADGTIAQDEWDAMALPSYQRSTEELLSPLQQEPLAGQLEIEAYADLVQPNPLWTHYEQTGDARAYADASVGAARAAMEPILSSCLDDARAADDRDRVMNEFYARVRDVVVDDPCGVQAMETAALILRRR